MPKAYLTDSLLQGLDADRVKGGRATETWWDEKEPGFGVRVSGRTGRRVFVCRYRARGKRRRVTLGPYPELSLKEARNRAKGIKAEAALGGDPAAAGPAGGSGKTFAEVADGYLDHDEHGGALAESTRNDYRKILEADAKPALGSMPVDKIDRHDVRELVQRVTDRGAPVQASKVRSVVSNVFEYARDRNLVADNPAQAVQAPKRGGDRQRWLHLDEIKAVWSALAGESPVVSSIWRIRLLTGARGTEIKMMRHEDVNGDTWTIPASVHKTGKRLEVPLSTQAQRVLESLDPFHRDGVPWVFPSNRTDSHIVQTKHLLRRVREATGLDFQARDLRRTFATHLAKMGVERIVVSHLLGHSVREVTDVYDRYRYEPEMREAVERWGDKLEDSVGSIVPGE